MADAAKVSPQHIVPLATFVELRRPYEQKKPYSWIRDCKAKKIPGAFQWHGKGAWYVNLDEYDAEVQKLSAPQTPAPDNDILALMERLDLSEADMRTVLRAAGR